MESIKFFLVEILEKDIKMIEVDIKELFFLIQEFQPFLNKKIPLHEIQSHLFLLDLLYDFNLKNNGSWKYFISSRRLDGYGVDSFFYNGYLQEYAFLQMKHKSIGNFSESDFNYISDSYNSIRFKKYNLPYCFLYSLSSLEALETSRNVFNGLVESSVLFNPNSHFFQYGIENTGKKTFWIDKNLTSKNEVNTWLSNLGLPTGLEYNEVTTDLVSRLEDNRLLPPRSTSMHHFKVNYSFLRLFFKR